MTLAAALVGYLVGSLPSAGLLGRLQGVDLRAQGSGNPGTANALRTSGPWLAAAVLVVEAAKGYAAVALGLELAADVGAIAAGLGAVTGNVYNIWYRFEGGKGLGISLGVLGAIWPAVLLPVVAVIGLTVLVTRSSGIASLAAIVALVVLAALWSAYGWPTGGVEPTGQLIVLAVGTGLIIFWKHWQASPFSSPARR